MRQISPKSTERVGLYLKPHTRNRLNKFKAALTLNTGKFMSQDEAVNILIDHYAETAPQEVAHLARTLQPA